MAAQEGKATEAAKGLHLVVGVDGSDSSHNAFLTACQLTKKEDAITTFHVFNKGRDSSLGRAFKSSAVETLYSSALAGRFSASRSAMRMVESRAVDQPRRKTVLTFVNGLQPPASFFFTGDTGTKGRKSDLTVLGSTADLSLRGALTTSVIIKTDAATTAGAKRFMVGVDGSTRSQFTLDTVRALAGDSDAIDVVYVYDAVSQGDLPAAFQVEGVTAFFTEHCEGDARCTFRAVDTTGSGAGSLAAALSALPEEGEGAMFLAVGADGMSAFAAGQKAVSLGSFSEHVVKHCRCNVIVVQDVDEVHSASGVDTKTAATHK